MAQISFGNINLGTAPQATANELGPQEPFRILVLADLSGRANRDETDIASISKRRPIAIDRDNYEEVLKRLKVRLQHSISDQDGKPVALEFKELDHFEPDHIFDTHPLFAYLRQMRRRLKNNDLFADAAEEIRGWAGVDLPEDDAAATPQESPPTDAPDDLLAMALDQTPTEEQTGVGSERWNRLLADLVAPYVTPGADPQQGQFVQIVDDAVARTMSSLLHHKDFQQLESTWRSLFMLIRKLETDESLKVSILDISRLEIITDLASSDDLQDTGLYKLLVEQTVETPGGKPWSLIVGDYAFSSGQADASLLGRIAQIVARAQSAFVASSTGTVVGWTDPEMKELDDWEDIEASDLWALLQNIPDAGYVGLVWPRFLIRLPYGSKTNPIDSFAYEECDSSWKHSDYLWSNGAFALACMLGESYTNSKWNMRLGECNELGDLPVHVFEEDGEMTARICGEVLITERAVERFIALSLMPLVSVRHEDSIRITNMQSLTGDTLKGPWN